MARKIVAICGDAICEENTPKYQVAYEIGKALVENGFRIQTGGGYGVMAAAFKGAHDASNYREGDTIAILPYFDRTNTNEYADIAIPTGLDLYRNLIVANADAVVVVGGGAGTLSEAALAWSMKRLIIAIDSVEGWSQKLAGQPLDHRKRYPSIPEDKAYAASNADDVIKLIKQYIDQYDRPHSGILF